MSPKNVAWWRLVVQGVRRQTCLGWQSNLSGAVGLLVDKEVCLPVPDGVGLEVGLLVG